MLKKLLTDESAKYVFCALWWFAILAGIITGLVWGVAGIPNILLRIATGVLGVFCLLGWMFIGCVAAIRMLRVS